MPGFLVSLCNVDGKPGLVRFDPATGFAPLGLPILGEPGLGRGMTGIAAFAGGFAVAPQGIASHVLLIDAEFGAARLARLPHAADVHGLLAHEDGLLVVSSGTNQVLRYDAALRFAGVFGRDDGVLLDRDHLNDIAMLDGRVLVSGFGPRRPNGLRLGFLRDAMTGETLFDGLNEPHSLTVQDGAACLLDSATGTLLRLVPAIGAVREALILGYARGLHIDASRILIGRSAARAIGRTTLFNHPARRAATRQGGQEVTTAGIFVIDRAADSNTFHPLGALGSEIYAIHHLP